MNKGEESKLNMYHAVINYCNSLPAVVASIPAFQAAFIIFQSKVSVITASVQAELNIISGIAADKAQLKADLCSSTADMAAAIYAYAASTNNNQLKMEVNYAASTLKRMKDDLLGPVCKNIIAAANANIAALQGYGINAAAITALNNKIAAYAASVSAPRNAVSQRSATVAAIDQLFKEADAVLKEQMDKLVPQFKKTQPAFYSVYINNRIIIDAAVTSTKIKGVVTSATDQAGVAGAVISITGQEEKATTDMSGKFMMLVKPGVYNLQYSKPGYQDKLVNNLVVKLGKEIMADAEMVG